MMFEPSVEVIEEHHCSYNFFRDPFKRGIIHIRDEKFPMFVGRRIRFNQLKRASKIYYYRRSHTDWEG